MTSPEVSLQWKREICCRTNRNVLAHILRDAAARSLLPLSLQVGIGLVGVSLAFGLSVVTMAYAIGHVSGCHLNPAVTVGLAAGGRFPAGQILPYVIAQVAGAIVAAALLYVIASGVRDLTSARALPPTATLRIRQVSTICSSASSPKWS